jgi:hypothetical protein
MAPVVHYARPITAALFNAGLPHVRGCILSLVRRGLFVSTKLDA